MIAIYGGSFNPIHKSHLNIIRNLSECDLFSSVWVIPTFNGFSSNKKLIDSKHRIKMIELSLIDEKLFNVYCKDIEIENKIEYTYQTLGYLNNQYREKEFALIVGSDVNPKTFRNYDIIKHTKCLKDIYMITRAGTEVDKEMNRLDMTVGDLSSTDIRKRLYWKQDMSKYLTKSVIEYIADNKLY